MMKKTDGDAGGDELCSTHLRVSSAVCSMRCSTTAVASTCSSVISSWCLAAWRSISSTPSLARPLPCSWSVFVHHNLVCLQLSSDVHMYPYQRVDWALLLCTTAQTAVNPYVKLSYIRYVFDTPPYILDPTPLWCDLAPHQDYWDPAV